METMVIGELIAAAAAIITAIIGAVVALRKKNDSQSSQKPPGISSNRTTIKQTGKDKAKQISTESMSGGTVIQADKIETLQLSQNKNESRVDLRLVDITVEEPIENYPLLEAPSGEQEEGTKILINPTAHFIADRPMGFPILDIKLRNAGNETVVLKKAEFKILKVARFKNPRVSMYSILPVSWNYTVLFSPGLEGQTVPANMSHSLQPNEAERFTFTIGQKDAPVDTPVWYYFQLDLVFNEDNDRISSEPILLSVPSQTLAAGQTQTEFHKDYLEYNRKIIQEFSELPGEKSPGVQKVIEGTV